jgi:hypothetical protein
MLSTPGGNLPDDVEKLSTPVGNLPDDAEKLSTPVGNLPDNVEKLSTPVGNLPDDVEKVSTPVGCHSDFNISRLKRPKIGTFIFSNLKNDDDGTDSFFSSRIQAS